MEQKLHNDARHQLLKVLVDALEQELSSLKNKAIK